MSELVEIDGLTSDRVKRRVDASPGPAVTPFSAPVRTTTLFDVRVPNGYVVIEQAASAYSPIARPEQPLPPPTTVRMNAVKVTTWRDYLPREIVPEVRWEVPCRALFSYLVEHSPRTLVRLASSGVLDPVELSFAAEALGLVEPPQFARPVLSRLLAHPDPIVREGAIYGLATHLDSTLASSLTRLAERDPSPGVRLAAEETLLELEE